MRVEPLDQARPAPARQLRRVGDEDLVDAAGLEQLAVERRRRPRTAARGRPARLAGGRAPRSDRPGPRGGPRRPASLSRAAHRSDAVKITILPTASVKIGASHGRSRLPETITISGSGARPRLSRFSRFAGSPTTRPYFSARSVPGADHHRVAAGAKGDEHLRVPARADAPRNPVDRRMPVQREREVHVDEGTLGRRLVPRGELLDQVGNGHLCGWLWQEAAHGWTVPTKPSSTASGWKGRCRQSSAGARRLRHRPPLRSARPRTRRPGSPRAQPRMSCAG